MSRILPPSLVLVLAGGQTLVTALPTPTFVEGPIRWTGLAAVAAGLGLTAGGARQFERRRTNIVTFDDPDVLVVDGVFAWTRNPMYLGFTIALAGGAVVSGAWLAVLGPVVFGAAANWWYIPFEERRMTAIFGDAYDRYRRRVGRWFGRPSTPEVAT